MDEWDYGGQDHAKTEGDEEILRVGKHDGSRVVGTVSQAMTLDRYFSVMGASLTARTRSPTGRY